MQYAEYRSAAGQPGLIHAPLQISDSDCDLFWSFGGGESHADVPFVDRRVTRKTIEALGAQPYVLAINDVLGILDVLIRFQPNTPGKLHRRLCNFSPLVLLGKLRFWCPDSSLLAASKRQKRPLPGAIRS